MREQERKRKENRNDANEEAGERKMRFQVGKFEEMFSQKTKIFPSKRERWRFF